jgi:putative heme iron utilization protein
VILRRGEADTAVQLHYIEADKQQRLSNEHFVQAITVTEQPGATDIAQRIRAALNENPSMSKSALARELNISRTTVYAHLPAAPVASTNGHKQHEVING